MKLVDTSAAVGHLRGDKAATEAMIEVLSSGERLVATEIVWFELLSGALSGALSGVLPGVLPGEHDALEDVSKAIEWLPVTEELTREAAVPTRQFRRSHRGIDAASYLITATARILDADLLTRNVRRFPMIEGLRSPCGDARTNRVARRNGRPQSWAAASAWLTQVSYISA